MCHGMSFNLMDYVACIHVPPSFFILQYSGWTSQAKALYLGVNVTFVFQSRYDTVVQMVGFKPEGEEEEKEAEASKDDSNKQ